METKNHLLKDLGFSDQFIQELDAFPNYPKAIETSQTHFVVPVSDTSSSTTLIIKQTEPPVDLTSFSTF